MCQIDMPTQRNDNIHKSATEFPFKPFGLAIRHLALSIISRLLESPLYHRMAGRLYAISHRLPCQMLSSEILPMKGTVGGLKGKRERKICVCVCVCFFFPALASRAVHVQALGSCLGSTFPQQWQRWCPINLSSLMLLAPAPATATSEAGGCGSQVLQHQRGYGLPVEFSR